MSDPLLSASPNDSDDKSEQLECSICLEDFVSSQNSIENESTSNDSKYSQGDEDYRHFVDLEAQNSTVNNPVEQKELPTTLSRRLKTFVNKIMTKNSTQTYQSENEEIVKLDECSVCFFVIFNLSILT